MKQRRQKGFTFVLAIVFLGLLTLSMAILTTQNGQALRQTRNLEARTALRNLSYSVGCLLQDEQRLLQLAARQQDATTGGGRINWSAVDPNGLVVQLDPNLPGIASEAVTLTFKPADNQACRVDALLYCRNQSFNHTIHLNTIIPLPVETPVSTPILRP